MVQCGFPEQTPDRGKHRLFGYYLVMAGDLLEPRVLLADRGYDADRIRKTMSERDILTHIPMRNTRKMRVGADRGLLYLRNMVDRCFNNLKNARRFATDTTKPLKVTSPY